MNFEIGDIVEIGGVNEWMQVVGVIHDEERIFVSKPPEWNEEEYSFDAVIAQYRRIL